MNQDQQDRLRAPFPPEQIGKLPRITCGACRDKKCDQHRKSRCDVCGSWITPAHLHLDFVGHADLTDRLLAVDREWTWEPVAFDPDGLPKFDSYGGLWMRLTVAGVTRLGYGHPDGKRGGDAVKETIGDGLRNAGMRFGVALDLWRKDPAPVEDRSEPAHPEPPEIDDATRARGQLRAVCERLGLEGSENLRRVADAYQARTHTELRAETDAEAIRAFAVALEDDPDLTLVNIGDEAGQP